MALQVILSLAELHEALDDDVKKSLRTHSRSYGTVLSPLPGDTKTFHDESSIDDPDQGNLSRALGSVVGIAALRAEGRVGPQLVSHTFGLLKARYVEGLSAEDAWLSSDEGTEWVLRTVDEILDVVSSEEDQGNVVKVKL
ncbi:hypothetical protein C0991_005963 [Blastosporella zonata]|nr:hypothetical protein C0991_005963 [Blastosporella zonata]